MGNLSRRLREIDMNDIPVDRAGRPMFDADGKKLSIADRELKTAKAAHHWAVIERDKLREANKALEAENERLRRAIQTELDNIIADGWINRDALAKALEKADE